MLIGPMLPPARLSTRPAAPTPPGTSPEEVALLEREQTFDLTLRERAEADRELNAVRDLYAQQRRRDDEYLRKLIELI
jgi:hypothetical protein